MSSMEDLKDIVGILDMDGFEIKKKFYCKELGLLRKGDLYASSYFFDIGIKWEELDQKMKKHCRFVSRNIHHLPFGVPSGRFAFKSHEINDIVLKFYEQYHIDESSKIAYKGGHYERDLLVLLGIPSVNLETFGCPKAELLFDELGWLETCGHHFPGRDVYKHCPKVEVEAFGYWLNEQL